MGVLLLLPARDQKPHPRGTRHGLQRRQPRSLELLCEEIALVLQQAHPASRRRTGPASVQLGRPREANQVYKRNRGFGDETGRCDGQGRNLGTWRYDGWSRDVGQSTTTKHAYFMLALVCVGALA